MAEEMSQKYADYAPKAHKSLSDDTLIVGNAMSSVLMRAKEAQDLPGRMTQLIFQAISCTPCVQKPRLFRRDINTYHITNRGGTNQIMT